MRRALSLHLRFLAWHAALPALLLALLAAAPAAAQTARTTGLIADTLATSGSVLAGLPDSVEVRDVARHCWSWRPLRTTTWRTLSCQQVTLRDTVLRRLTAPPPADTVTPPPPPPVDTVPPPVVAAGEPDPARAAQVLVAHNFNVASTAQLGAGWVSAVNEPGTSISFVPGRSGNAIRCNYPAIAEARCITEYYGWWNRQPPYALTHWVRIQPGVQMSGTGNKGMRLFTGVRQAAWGNEALSSIEWGGGVRIWSFGFNDTDRFPGDDGQLLTLNGSGNAWGIQQNVNRSVKWGQSPEQPKRAGVTYLNDGQWHRVTARVDGTPTTARVRVWVDGILVTDSRPTAGATCWNLATRTQSSTNCAITGTDITHLGVVGFSFPLNIVDPPPTGAFWYDVDDLALFVPGE